MTRTISFTRCLATAALVALFACSGAGTTLAPSPAPSGDRPDTAAAPSGAVDDDGPVAWPPQRIPATASRSKSNQHCGSEERCGLVELPDGVVLSGGCSLHAQRGEVSAAIVALDPSGGDNGECPFLLAVTVRADGKLAIEDSWKGDTQVTREQLEARLDHAEAMSHLQGQRWAQAVALLERAERLEPGRRPVALALARAHIGLAQPARGAAALAALVRQAPVATYAEVAQRHDLHPVLDHEPFLGVRAERPGRAQLTIADSLALETGGPGRAPAIVAHAPHLGLLALEQRRTVWRDGTSYYRTNLLLFDAERIHAVVHLMSESYDYDPKRQQAALPGRLQAANRLLRDLGFNALTGVEWATFARPRGEVKPAQLPGGQLEVTFLDGFVELLRAGKSVLERQIHADCSKDENLENHVCSYPPWPIWVARVPSLDLVLLQWTTSTAEHHEAITRIEWMALSGIGGGTLVMPIERNRPRAQ